MFEAIPIIQAPSACDIVPDIKNSNTQKGNTMARPRLEDWRAESIRFSYFFAEAVPEQLREGLWRAITGSDPESSTLRKAEGVLHEQGPFLGGVLAIFTGPNRIDILLTPTVVANDFPNIGEIGTVHNELLRVLHQARFDIAAETVRLAYGLVANIRTSNRDESYRILDELLSRVTVDPVGRDFHYQINYPRASTVNDKITLNRLSRWSAAFTKQFQPGNVVDNLEIHVTRVEFDINTAPDVSIEGTDKAKLMDELIDSARTMLTEGDR
ncbi:hypothetical protein QZM18_13960 [Burkholderia diffusa]|uniref:hypothetical protein n=1 Tax=Burkholderia diffusa TaxID=488732 RepID=UPI002654B490|nr:hypothetical protein [Burkholderia diffusa]MDN7905217.1 hypothetical protein [Burkholderia diffusa]